jgi:transcriptional regulator with XRE-family HTH domain
MEWSIVLLILYKHAVMNRMGNKMPAKAPPLGDLLAARLLTLGERIRAQRVQQKVSATAAAEAAGMSRVTLYRIEHGEPSVTMGAYLSAIAAVGLQLEVTDPHAVKAAAATPAVPDRVRLGDYPELKRLAWQVRGVTDLSPAEALSLYERNWRHVDQARMQPGERALVQALVTGLGGGRLLV